MNLFVLFKLVEKCVAHIHDTNVNELHNVTSEVDIQIIMFIMI